MNLNNYIIQKDLEKAKTEIIKQMICNDMNLSNQQKNLTLLTLIQE